MIQKVFTASTLLQIFEAMIAANKKPAENVDKYPVTKQKVDPLTDINNKEHGLTKEMMAIIQSPGALH